MSAPGAARRPQFGLSEITVKLYRASVMKKMAARTLADLARMAERLDPEPESP